MKNKGIIELLTGNEAIARGAYEGGVKVAVAYPGTPSTEILENISKYSEIYSQWSVNEKVAMEVASGSSISGARSLVAMKHVGLNVASDPFMTLSYTGVNGGLVIISADDPDMHSSQNEQDNRYYPKFSKIPMLEPSDSQEAKDFVIEALNISERFDTPVLIRTTTRISHSSSVVRLKERIKIENMQYKKDSKKYVMIPAYGRSRHKILLERWKKLEDFSNNFYSNCVYIPSNNLVKNTYLKNNINIFKDTGIITSGVSYQYAREVFYNFSILKLSMASPFPNKIVEKFVRGKKLLIVIEELEPFLEEQIRLLNLKVKIIGKKYFPQFGELNLEILSDFYDYITKNSNNFILNNKIVSIVKENKAAVSKNSDSFKSLDLANLPPRPPVLCAGCPHRSVFYILKKLRVIVMGDIGCYTLSVLPPLNSMDSCLCMGAGIGQALGMEKANPKVKGEIVSVIGDSTFFHSGITPLIDNVYNKGSGLIIILDNRTTAMTGHQVHPGVGKTLMGKDTLMIKPEAIAKAVGVKNVRVVNPYNIKLLEKTIKEELKKDGLSVVISRQKCVLLDKSKIKKAAVIDLEKCEKCGLCLKFGCPAIEYSDDIYFINDILCTGCSVCIDICKKSAIFIGK